MATLAVLLGAGESARGQAPEACATQAAQANPQPAGWFEVYKKFKTDMEKTTGTSFDLCAITTSQVILNGQGEGKDRTVFWWNLNVTQRLWPGAKLISNTRGGAGRGVSHIVGDQHCLNWMGGEPREMYVSHLLLEQKLFGDRLTLAAGKLDLGDYFDCNEYAGWDFLSYSLARNPTLPLAWHSIGALVKVEPAPWLYLQAGAADAQGSFTETGLNTAFHDEDYFVSLYEVGLRPRFFGRPGTYRFILWYDPQPLAEIDGTGHQRDTLGFAVNFDQRITDRLGMFFRYGYADETVRAVENFWSLGATYKGPVPRRSDDVLAFGVGQAVMGGDYRRAHSSASTDTIMEVFYRFKVTEWMSITPDVQVILNPGADLGRDVGVVGGLKVCLSF